MRQRSRLATVAVAAALVAAACSGGGDDSAGTTAATTATGDQTTTAAATTAPGPQLPDCPVDALGSATAPVQITVWHAMQQELEKALVALTDQYNASQSKVVVTLVNQVGYQENLDKYRSARPEDRPEVVQMYEAATQLLVDSGTALPVAACVRADGYDTSDYLPQVLGAYTLEDVLWPMPFNVSNPILYYNKKVFAAAGLDPEKPPTTLEELRSVSEKIVSSGAAKFGIAFDSGPDSGGGWYLEQWFAKAGQLYANNDNGRSGKATEVLFDNQLGVDSMTFLQKMVGDGLAVSVGRNASGQDTLLKMVDQAAPSAMAIVTSAGLAAVYNVLPQFPQVELGTGPMPGPAGAGGVLVGGAAMWIVKDKAPEKIAAAWDYLKYLTQPEQQAQWSTSTGYVPIRKSAAALPAVQQQWAERPGFKTPYDQLLASPADTPAGAGPVLGPQRQIRELTAQALDDVFAGKDVAATLATAKAQADQLLADYARRSGG